MNGPSLISITRLPPRAEINKQIFVIVYRSIFTGFTITISCFQVFYIFFILSFLFIFWLCLAFVFSGFTFLLYFLLFYIFSFLPISLYIFGLSISFIFWGFTLFSIFSSFLYFLYFYAFHMYYISNFSYLLLQRLQLCISYQWCWRIDDCGEVTKKWVNIFTT